MQDLSPKDDGSIKHPWRYALVVIGAVPLSVLLAFLAMELHLQWHLFTNGLQRQDTANDYGLAFDSVLLGFVILVTSYPVIAFLLIRMVRNSARRQDPSQ